MTVLLALPAIVVTIVLLRHLVRHRGGHRHGRRRFDWGGFVLITVALGLVMGGLIAIRLQGPDSLLAWALMLLGLLAWSRSSATRPRSPSRWSTYACSPPRASGRCS